MKEKKKIQVGLEERKVLRHEVNASEPKHIFMWNVSVWEWKWCTLKILKLKFQFENWKFQGVFESLDKT